MKIAILGGAGKMGQWLARVLGENGEDLLLVDRNPLALIEAGERLCMRTSNRNCDAAGADAVIIAVPIDKFESTVREFAVFAQTGQIVIDITSVKGMPVEIMHRLLPQSRILGTHPVFGPGAAGFRGHNVVLTPRDQADEALTSKVQAYLETLGARVSVMSPAKHDHLMAAVLGLAHYIAITAGDALLSQPDLKQMEAIGGMTFKALLTLIESVLSEDPALYASIQMHLPTLPDMQSDFVTRSGAWAEMVRAGDEKAFIQRMTALKERLRELDLDTARAYGNMYKLADSEQAAG
jgi:prephenate dehydrogenase